MWGCTGNGNSPSSPTRANNLAKSRWRNRCAPLRQEDVPRFDLFALEPTQIPDLAAAHRMHAWHSAFDAADMQQPLRKVKLIPAQCAQLGSPEPCRYATTIIVASQ